MSARSGPLAGMRVIELAHIMAGPVCGMMLADMGADVVKVEKPTGDDSRRFVPPKVGDEAAAYMMMNRNKRGIALNLKDPGAVDVLRRLLADADVVIENYRKGTMEKLGLSYEELAEANPRLIYCEISGFGRTGPYADRGGFDLIAQGMSGLMSITGEGPGRPPVKVAAPISDINAGILAAMGVSAAYANAQKTGLGQKVDTSLFEAAIVQTYWQSAIAFATGNRPEPLGSAHPLNAPYQSFQTSDGWINVGAANQGNWLRYLEVIGAPELNDDPRFSSNAARMENLDALVEILNGYMAQDTTENWLSRMERASLPAGPVNDILQMHEDPQALARDMILEVDHSTAGKVKTLGHPVKFSRTPAKVAMAAPVLGQHTRAVLEEAGYNAGQIDALIEAEAIIAA
ncbi:MULTISPECIES: CaiB/BaiF CoA transferase family protein [unclassified Sulfitobacter]|uniref:CaiB/BaiF CoA transferase family protein n=1 Tax=unclassified Sulfitobacter TaxID=196795 RepID=UPI0007C3AAD9|nr:MULTISPECIES: CoA transferase [unclassified Sulfitobacter]KZX96878.1 CoA-transferase [Sulfitobacter sp. HI0023]KZY24069.1 CoA-transferase [Sulfitobacter sp. HI0040]KZZ69877.1 CoA-transferase [Sulfitobacter sp. HI0129]